MMLRSIGIALLMSFLLIVSAQAEQTFREAYDQAIVSYRKRAWLEAQKGLLAAAELAENDRDRGSALVVAGNCEINRGKKRDLAKARVFFERVIALEGAHPNHVSTARSQIGVTWVFEKNYDEAGRIFAALVADEDVAAVFRASAQMQIARIAILRDKDYEKAIAEYKKVFDIKGVPGTSASGAQSGIADTLNRWKKYEEAIEAYDKVAAIEGAHRQHVAGSVLQKGNIYRVMKQYDQAHAMFEQVLAMEDAISVYKRRALQFDAAAWRDQGDAAKARQQFEKLLAMPDIPEAEITTVKKLMAQLEPSAK